MKKLILAISMMAMMSEAAYAADPLTNFLNGLFKKSEPTVKVRVVKGLRTHQIAGNVEPSSVWRHMRASFYGGGPKAYEPNNHTANGERFNQWGLTAAHRTLPFGTMLNVHYNGRSVVVRINDRGPAAWTGRDLDLSRGAAMRLGFPGTGTVQVTSVN
jgi:rare lipoprotein A (peptidoglycan hydrolase)